MNRKSLFALFALVVLVLGSSLKARAETVSAYEMTYTAVAQTLDGTKRKFVARGTGTWNEKTGEFNYNMAVSPEEQITGIGSFGAGPKLGFGSSTFDGATFAGVAVISGKFNRGRTRFTGNIVVGLPNRAGPPPQGFVKVTGKLVMEKTTAPM